MGQINTLNKRKINIKTKRVAKAKKLRIVESKSNIYIEIVPDYHSDLSVDEINELYLSFLKLGRKLYQENKDRDNISKIKFNYFKMDLFNLRYLLKGNGAYADEFTLDYVKKWVEKNNIWNTDKFSDYFFLKSDQNLRIDTITEWLKYNYVPIETDVEDDDFWMYVNYQKLIDLSMFIYLITYSIRNELNHDVNITNDNIKFQDFIEAENGLLSDEVNYIELINNMMHMYELHNMRYLYGYNKLKYNKDEDRLEMIIEYDDIFGVIWYIFKLYLVNSSNDSQGNTIPISICNECGNPFLGNRLRCNDCEYDNQRVRKNKSRRNTLDAIDKIKEITETHELPSSLIREVNKYINLPKSKLYNNKTNIDKLLTKITNYIKKES